MFAWFTLSCITVLCSRNRQAHTNIRSRDSWHKRFHLCMSYAHLYIYLCVRISRIVLARMSCAYRALAAMLFCARRRVSFMSVARPVRTRGRAPFTCITLYPHEIKSFAYNHSCHLISYLFNHPQLK
jgi:hypothetical protein